MLTKPVEPSCPIPEASTVRLRPVSKAMHQGMVRMSGGYGVPGKGAHEHPDFDRQEHVEWCVAHGYLTGGPYANTYVATTAGQAAYATYMKFLNEQADYKEAMAKWRAATKPKEPASHDG